MLKNLKLATGLALALAALSMPALAQDAAAAPVPDKADTAFMTIATVLVLFMAVPGVGLFYGGLVRSKNMASVLMQSVVIAAAMIVIWVIYGYSFAFGGSTNPFFGGFGKLFLSGVTGESTAATFSDGVVIYEYTFMAFQMTFAALTPVLIIGAFAERIKFGAAVLFCVLWATFVYFPIAHMVWDANGYIFGLGALDFAGGTVVHINAGIAGLVGAYMVGKRTGYGKDNMAPHSLTLTTVGAAILWIGWFGFNAGSNLEASGGAVLATVNTFVATGAAILSWSVVESITRGKASLLGAVSGMIAGLVAVTPAAGSVGPIGAIVLGIVVSPVCYFFVAVVKAKFGYDDTADVFGVHGVGGILGAIGTGIFTAPSLGGTGGEDFSIGGQVWVQFVAVAITIVWGVIVSAILYKLVDLIIGLRVSVEAEREGLDLSSHGETAYH